MVGSYTDTLLTFILDLTKGEFSIPPGKIDHLFNQISLLLDDVSPTARDVSRITGTSYFHGARIRSSCAFAHPSPVRSP